MANIGKLKNIKDRGTHRYWLWRKNKHRTAESDKIAAWVLCNPSWSRRLEGEPVIKGHTTMEDDLTVKKVRKLTFQPSFCGHSYKGLFVLNLYPYRAPNSELLRQKTGCPLGYSHTDQKDALEAVFECSDYLFFAWGAVAGKAGKANFEKAETQVRNLAKCAGHKKYFYLDLTTGGHPRHPSRFGKFPLPELCSKNI